MADRAAAVSEMKLRYLLVPMSWIGSEAMSTRSLGAIELALTILAAMPYTAQVTRVKPHVIATTYGEVDDRSSMVIPDCIYNTIHSRKYLLLENDAFLQSVLGDIKRPNSFAGLQLTPLFFSSRGENYVQ